MKTSRLFKLPVLILPLLVLFSCSESNEPQKKKEVKSLTLAIDSFKNGDNKVFQGGFLSGEEAAVTLGPLESPFAIRNVQFFFGGGTPNDRNIQLKIYEEDGNKEPGQLLHSSQHLITPVDNTIRHINLSSYGLEVGANRKIRVSVEMTASSLPCIARDSGQVIIAGRNWVKTKDGTWYKAEDFGVEGNWIIRAGVAVEVE